MAADYGVAVPDLLPKQAEAMAWSLGLHPKSPEFMLVWAGAIRSGKTWGLTLAQLVHGLRYGCPEAAPGVIAGRRMETVSANLLPLYREHAATLGLSYRKSGASLTVGPLRFRLFGANNELAASALQGLTASSVLLDEVALMPRSFVDECVARSSLDHSRIFATANPEGPQHFVKRDFIDAGRCWFLPAYLDDNPHVSDAVKDRYAGMFDGHVAARKLRGEWAGAVGLVFSRWTLAPDDLPMPGGVWDVGADWGTATVTAAVQVAQLSDVSGGSWLVWDEYYWDAEATGAQRTVEEHAAAIAELYRRAVRPGELVLDPSATALRLALRRNLGLRNHAGDNDVLNGIAEVDYLLSSGRLMIHPRCVNLIRELQLYAWDDKMQSDGVDRPVKRNDHAIDAMRYWAMRRFRGHVEH